MISDITRTPEHDNRFYWFPHIINNKRYRNDLKYRIFIRTEKMRFERKVKANLARS